MQLFIKIKLNVKYKFPLTQQYFENTMIRNPKNKNIILLESS